MEEYEIVGINNTQSSITIKQGRFYSKIHKKHIESYGEYGAQNIRDNIMSTFREALIQENDTSMSNNMLLVGKVQSGKTSNLELFTALAFDNGYNLVIIYGGYDSTLLSQTTNRFRKTFDIPLDTNYSDGLPVVFSSDDSAQLLTVDDEIVEDLISANKPIFLISMKRPQAMNKVNDLLERIDKSQLKAFIIDDEGDQASLNTNGRNPQAVASATYAAIVRMKNLLNDPLYLSVTATPQALIFQDDFSRLRPDSIRLIEPGKGYCGADCYHLFNSEAIETVEDADLQDIGDGVMADSLRNAIKHYIVASAIMDKRGVPTSDMIIHSHRNVSDHDTIYRLVSAYVQTLKDQILYEDEDSLAITKNELYLAYQSFFNDEIRSEYMFDDLWPTICSKVISRIYIILKNSTGQVTQANEPLRKHKIYIGGDLLQRGVTFSSLVTTYFLRWPRASGGNMDTNLQRARWFGYRGKYIDICKIFTSNTISREFTTLSEVESDLWEQFNAIQNGEMRIDEILVRAEGTSQRPTRRNVANYNAVVFRNKWIKQRVGIFDLNQVSENNRLVDDLFAGRNLLPTSAGRTDGAQSAEYVVMHHEDLLALIDHMQAIFDLEPFERRPLIDLIEDSEDIPVIRMPDVNGSGRNRSFYSDNKIYALQQGANDKDPERATYLGDSHVVVDPERINIQIHKVVPMKKNAAGVKVALNDFTQYMFAIYVPKEKRYFSRG